MRILTIAALLLISTSAWATNPTETPEVPEEVLVEHVTRAIMTVHQDQPECGSYCTSSRRDRAALPDWSDSVISEEEARYMAEAIVWTSEQYNVPLDEVLATAYQESRFRYMAVGGGTECGMFQQTTLYFRWEAYDEDHPAESREPVNEVSVKVESDILTIEVPDNYSGHSYYEDTGALACAYLLDPYNAGWQFALKYHHYIDRFGEYDWSRHYNGGPDQYGYANRHRSYQSQYIAYLDYERDVYLASLEEEVEEDPVVQVSAEVNNDGEEIESQVAKQDLSGSI